MVSVGGTSGTTQPQWNETAGTTTLDAAVKWTNAGTLIWQPTTAYALSASLWPLDPNGGIQLVQTAGTSGATAPTWADTTGGVTTDNTVQWSNNSFVSIDIQTLLNIAFNQASPHVVESTTDSSNTARSINLLSAADSALLSSGGNGLQSLVTSLKVRGSPPRTTCWIPAF